MKLIVRIVGVTLAALLPAGLVQAQSSPSPAAASTEKAAETSAPARTDVYHVYFGKATPGKAQQLAEFLKTPDPKAPMPGHMLILRHQEGDAWDYVAIEHLGTKATVEATPFQMPPGMRDITEWHNDTFVNGPSWAKFTRALGIGDDASKSGGSVYVISTYRAVPGHRDQLEKFLSEPPDRSIDTSSGDVLMQHLEGGPWNFLTIVRYNSWQDFATNESNSVGQSAKNTGGWFKLREHISSHTDTVTYRISP
jgi:hypothetical protein